MTRLPDAILILTAAAGVPDAAADRALAHGATGCRRLSASALELTGDAARAGRALSGPPVDITVLPAGDRRKRLLVADMDSTMIPNECIDDLADLAGVKAEVADITDRAMQGELGFEAALAARVALLRGLPVAALEETWTSRIRLNPGARTLVRTMAAHGALTALVSGGFTFFTERVAAAAGFSRHHANTLIFEDGRLTGTVALPILGREAKRDTLLVLAAETGIPASAVLAVGDGANDIAMVETAGLGVAFRARPALKARAAAIIDHGDLTALLALQGYAESEHTA